MSWTMNLSWKASENLKLNLKVQNLLNRQPEYDPQGWNGTNIFASYDGRIVKFSANYSFK